MNVRILYTDWLFVVSILFLWMCETKILQEVESYNSCVVLSYGIENNWRKYFQL